MITKKGKGYPFYLDPLDLEDDGAHPIGTASDGDSFLLKVWEVPPEKQGPYTGVNSLPSGATEALGHACALKDELLAILVDTTGDEPAPLLHRIFVKDFLRVLTLQHSYL